MKKFFKDYSEYQKNRNELCKVWYKKHWKGTVLLNILVLVGMFGWFFRNDIKEKIFKSKKEEESVEGEW